MKVGDSVEFNSAESGKEIGTLCNEGQVELLIVTPECGFIVYRGEYLKPPRLGLWFFYKGELTSCSLEKIIPNSIKFLKGD